MARKGRRLRPDEAALWDSVARGVKPLDRSRSAKVEAPDAKRVAPPPPDPAAAGTAGLDHRASLPVSRRPTAFDRRQYRRLGRGRRTIDSTLDLHGSTQTAAHRQLIAHLQRAADEGQRCVLVITGKGGRRFRRGGGVPAEFRRRSDFDDQSGILRRAVPAWLETPPLADIVHSFAPAHLRHGGDGALYVLLRGRRKHARRS